MQNHSDSVTRRKVTAGVGGVKVSLVMPARLFARVDKLAKSERRSLSAQGVVLIESALLAREQTGASAAG